MKKEISPEDSYKLLDHGPTVLVSVYDATQERSNVFAVAWLMPVSFRPPLVALSVGEGNYSCSLIQEAGEFVINVPHAGMADVVAYAGSTSGREVDKFAHEGLTEEPAQQVRSARVSECIGHLECRLVDEKVFGETHVFFGRVVHACVDGDSFEDTWHFRSERHQTLHHIGNNRFAVPTRVVRGEATRR